MTTPTAGDIEAVRDITEHYMAGRITGTDHLERLVQLIADARAEGQRGLGIRCHRCGGAVEPQHALLGFRACQPCFDAAREGEKAHAAVVAMLTEGQKRPAPHAAIVAAEEGGAISHEEAHDIALAYIDHCFGNEEKHREHCYRITHSIPANPRRDSDIRLCAYIRQQRAKDEARAAEKKPEPAGDQHRLDAAQSSSKNSEECPHGDLCCQSEPCKGPQMACPRCKRATSQTDCICEGAGRVIAVEYINWLAREAAEGTRRLLLDTHRKVTSVR